MLPGLRHLTCPGSSHSRTASLHFPQCGMGLRGTQMDQEDASSGFQENGFYYVSFGRLA